MMRPPQGGKVHRALRRMGASLVSTVVQYTGTNVGKMGVAVAQQLIEGKPVDKNVPVPLVLVSE